MMVGLGTTMETISIAGVDGIHATSYMCSDDVQPAEEYLFRIRSSVVDMRHDKTAGVCWYYVRTYVCVSRTEKASWSG
jgi:hypothetical protein